MPGEEGNVLAPLPQGRKAHGEDVEAVEEVLPEPAVVHERAEVAVGGRQESDVYCGRVGCTHGPDLSLLDDA